jgi:hypothetical protein
MTVSDGRIAVAQIGRYCGRIAAFTITLYRFSTAANIRDAKRLILLAFPPYTEIISNSIWASSRGEKGEFGAGAIRDYRPTSNVRITTRLVSDLPSGSHSFG